MDKKTNPTVRYLQDTHFSFKNTQAKSKEMEKGIPHKQKLKESRVKYT